MEILAIVWLVKYFFYLGFWLLVVEIWIEYHLLFLVLLGFWPLLEVLIVTLSVLFIVLKRASQFGSRN